MATRIAGLERTHRRVLADFQTRRARAEMIAADPVAAYLYTVYHLATRPMIAADPEGERGTKWRLALLKDHRAHSALAYFCRRVQRLEGVHDDPLFLDWQLPWVLPFARALLQEVAALPGGAEAVDLTERDRSQPSPYGRTR